MSKKILTVGYYADFSRFFNKIAIETRRIDQNIDFLHIDLFLSGFLYSILHGQKSLYLPLKKGKQKKSSCEPAAEFFKQFIIYHQRLVPSLDEKKLIKQAEKYYHYLDELLLSYQPDLIIISGDSRMPAEIIKYLAVTKKIKVAFFEQAPLGRTMIDLKGVNANASFRTIDSETIHTYTSENYHLPTEAKWKNYKLFRVVDLIIEKFLPFIVPIEQKRPSRHKINNKQYLSLLEKKSLVPEKFSKLKKVLLVLQVPDDVNMIYHSPWFSSHYEIVKKVAENLPDNTLLIVREHPLFKKLYEEEMYYYIEKNEKVFFDNSGGLGNAISNSDLVVVNNSTVGLESIEQGKKVIVLGNSYYDRSDLCYKYNGGDLSTLINEVMECVIPEKSYRDKYLTYLFNHVFIPGHFRDVNGPAPTEIAKWIIKNV